MTDVATLAEEMRLGRLPEDWTQTGTMNVGDELASMIDRVNDGDELARDVWQAAITMAPECQNMSPASALSVILARFDTNKATADGLRETLVAFGALDADDDETDALALLRILLPPTG